MPSIDRSSSEPYYLQIYRQIATAIENGQYPAGKRLPSIRACARELGVSSTTIEFAYQRLVSEGYVEARRGSGHVVCATKSAPAQMPERSRVYLDALDELLGNEAASAGTARYDFAYDSVDPDAFPLVVWARICREVFFGEGAERSFLYDDAQGLAELREEIARYVNAEQGLDWSPEQVLVMPTTRDLITEMLSLFDKDGTVVGMEEPGYDEVSSVIRRLGFDMRAVSVHPTPSAEELMNAVDGVDVLFTTPTSQFPTNAPMPSDVRERLVKWAHDNDAYLICDDYGWELQSRIARTPSAATFDRDGRIIVTGTFSNSFTPAVCLSYALLPPQLMTRWRAANVGAHPRTPWQTQAAMAQLMREGQWGAHVRKSRTALQVKREALVRAIDRHLGDRFEYVESPNSKFVLLSALDGRKERDLIAAAERQGVRVYETMRYWQGQIPDDWNHVLVGFGGISIDDIEPGIEALARAWNAM